jgi:predicted protein tyrosine phosphatase
MAEGVFRIMAWSLPGGKDHEARSAGTDPDPSGRELTWRDVAWADVVCVMEPVHGAYIHERWKIPVEKIRVLGIPDIYQPGDPQLRELLTEHVRALLTEGVPTEIPERPAPRGPLRRG